MANWQHPTGKRPEKVAIVACGPTLNDWITSNMPYDRAYGRPDEVWVLNKGLRTIRGDMAFVMDEMEGEALKSEQYAEDIRALRIPIITSIIDHEVRGRYPDSGLHAYPLQEIYSWWGTRICKAHGHSLEWCLQNPNLVMESADAYIGYLHNSIPYILAYAAFIGVKKVGLFGADYTFPGQDIREDDRANCEYWVGMLRASGVQVIVPPSTTLLNTRYRKPLYGYGTRPPILTTPSIADIEDAYG